MNLVPNVNVVPAPTPPFLPWLFGIAGLSAALQWVAWVLAFYLAFRFLGVLERVARALESSRDVWPGGRQGGGGPATGGPAGGGPVTGGR